MSEEDKAAEVLQSLRPPTSNEITDKFGFYRHWGESTWNPRKGYAPIHAGIDYSSRPFDKIIAPCDGYVYGHKVEGSVGAVTYLRPIWEDEAIDNVMLVFMHCEPTESEWKKVSQGDVFTVQAGYGIGHPHLHFEIDVTKGVYKTLVKRKIISDKRLTKKSIREKALRKKLDPSSVMKSIKEQKSTWGGIPFMGLDAIIRSSLPPYRHSQYSKVGKSTTAILNPLIFLQSGDTY